MLCQFANVNCVIQCHLFGNVFHELFFLYYSYFLGFHFFVAAICWLCECKKNLKLKAAVYVFVCNFLISLKTMCVMLLFVLLCWSCLVVTYSRRMPEGNSAYVVYEAEFFFGEQSEGNAKNIFKNLML